MTKCIIYENPARKTIRDSAPRTRAEGELIFLVRSRAKYHGRGVCGVRDVEISTTITAPIHSRETAQVVAGIIRIQNGKREKTITVNESRILQFRACAKKSRCPASFAVFPSIVPCCLHADNPSPRQRRNHRASRSFQEPTGFGKDGTRLDVVFVSIHQV